MYSAWPGTRSKPWMSPGDPGATLTQPPAAPAVKVLRKNDSPPKAIFLRDLNRPPPLLRVCISTPPIATMAPGSTLTDSPGDSA